MKFTPEQIHEAEQLIVGQLKMHRNNTYPKEERALTTILLIIKNQKVETTFINNAHLTPHDSTLEVEDGV